MKTESQLFRGCSQLTVVVVCLATAFVPACSSKKRRADTKVADARGDGSVSDATTDAGADNDDTDRHEGDDAAMGIRVSLGRVFPTVTEASVTIRPVGGKKKALEGTTTNHGELNVNAAEVDQLEDDTHYIIEVAGGMIEAAGPQAAVFSGTFHAVASGDALKVGPVNLTYVSEIVHVYIAARLDEPKSELRDSGEVAQENVAAYVDQLAEALFVADVNGDDRIDALDVLAFNPDQDSDRLAFDSAALQVAINLGGQSTTLRAVLASGDEQSISEAVLEIFGLPKNGVPDFSRVTPNDDELRETMDAGSEDAGVGASEDPLDADVDAGQGAHCTYGDNAIDTIFTGLYHTCAIFQNRGLRCWGNNWGGLLGDGTTENRSARLAVEVLTNVQDVVVAVSYTCALSDDGALRCWRNTQEVIPAASHDPELVGVKAIAGNDNHTCALMQDGALRCWGGNALGQLGTGDTAAIASASLAPNVLTDVQAVSVGSAHTCALLEGGALRCWGRNNSGQLGDGTREDALSASLAPDLLTGVHAVSAGYDHTCALMETGALRCWGSNGYGQFGDGTSVANFTASLATDVLSDVQEVGTGNYFSCALRNDSAIRCWGYNGTGQLGGGGTGTTFSNISASMGPDVLTGVRSLAVGGTYVCAVMLDGGGRCWGQNSGGALGDGTEVPQSSAIDADLLFPCVP